MEREGSKERSRQGGWREVKESRQTRWREVRESRQGWWVDVRESMQGKWKELGGSRRGWWVGMSGSSTKACWALSIEVVERGGLGALSRGLKGIESSRVSSRGKELSGKEFSRVSHRGKKFSRKEVSRMSSRGKEFSKMCSRGKEFSRKEVSMVSSRGKAPSGMCSKTKQPSSKGMLTSWQAMGSKAKQHSRGEMLRQVMGSTGRQTSRVVEMPTLRQEMRQGVLRPCLHQLTGRMHLGSTQGKQGWERPACSQGIQQGLYCSALTQSSRALQSMTAAESSQGLWAMVAERTLRSSQWIAC
jgi:hypothetical protein